MYIICSPSSSLSIPQILSILIHTPETCLDCGEVVTKEQSNTLLLLTQYCHQSLGKNIYKFPLPSTSTVRFSKSFGYFMRCRSFLSICRKLQKSFLSAPAAKSRTNLARMSEFRDLVRKKLSTLIHFLI